MSKPVYSEAVREVAIAIVEDGGERELRVTMRGKELWPSMNRTYTDVTKRAMANLLQRFVDMNTSRYGYKEEDFKFTLVEPNCYESDTLEDSFFDDL